METLSPGFSHSIFSGPHLLCAGCFLEMPFVAPEAGLSVQADIKPEVAPSSPPPMQNLKQVL